MSALSMMPRVREILRYYATETNWQDRPNEHNQPRVECEIDRGKRARDLLAELEKDSGK